jgi:predicted permease
MTSDLQHAARMLAKSPGFTTAVVTLLALGIGVNTAVFSVANGVLLRPLPFAESERVVALWESKPQAGQPRQRVSPPTFLDWRAENPAFEAVSAFAETGKVYSDSESPELVPGMVVSANFFSLLRARALVGRTFTAEEEGWGRQKVIVLSHGLWQRLFGADRSIIGKTVTLSHENFEVVGVLPASFRFTEPADFWIPLSFRPSELSPGFRGARYLKVVARLKPGVTLAAARDSMAALAHRLGERYANNSGWSVSLTTLREDLASGHRKPLLLLMAAVVLVLLIACGNVANLLLSRAAGRGGETAIRAALGASRWRLTRQFLAEGAILATLGATGGLLLASWTLKPLLRLAPDALPRVEDVSIDTSVLAFTLTVSVLAALFLSMVPALRLPQCDLAPALRSRAAGSLASDGRARLRSAFVTLQVALAVVMVVGAGLLVRSFMRLRAVDPGFQPERAAALFLGLPQSSYASPRERIDFSRRLLESVRSTPGVKCAALGTNVPLNGTRMAFGFLLGDAPLPAEESQPAEYHAVSPDYFRTLGVPLLKGRDFAQQDDESGPPVVIVSRALAQRYWPGDSPLGKRIRTISQGITVREIVGVVGDVKHSAIAEQTKPQIYVPYAQDSWPFLALAVRGAAEGPSLSPAIRQQIRSLDKTLPVGELEPMERRVDASIAGNRFQAQLSALFAGLALLLATVGLSALLGHLVSQRTREIGIRKALGAQAVDIVRLVVGEALLLSALGLAIGLLAAFGLTCWLASLLFDVSPHDPATLAAACAVLLVGALIASYVPARRAAKVDPMVALRCE